MPSRFFVFSPRFRDDELRRIIKETSEKSVYAPGDAEHSLEVDQAITNAVINSSKLSGETKRALLDAAELQCSYVKIANTPTYEIKPEQVKAFFDLFESVSRKAYERTYGSHPDLLKKAIFSHSKGFASWRTFVEQRIGSGGEIPRRLLEKVAFLPGVSTMEYIQHLSGLLNFRVKVNPKTGEIMSKKTLTPERLVSDNALKHAKRARKIYYELFQTKS